MSDTPETDAHQRKPEMAHDHLWSDFARKLERERDEARRNIRTWQPIATAPKDGTKMDLWMPSGHRVTNCYWGRPEHSCGENEGYCDSHPDHDGWVDGEDFMNGYTTQEPTHWMPIPKPPCP